MMHRISKPEPSPPGAPGAQKVLSEGSVSAGKLNRAPRLAFQKCRGTEEALPPLRGLAQPLQPNHQLKFMCWGPTTERQRLENSSIRRS